MVPQLAILAWRLIISADWEGGLRLICASPASTWPASVASCWRITLWTQTAASANMETLRGSFLVKSNVYVQRTQRKVYIFSLAGVWSLALLLFSSQGCFISSEALILFFASLTSNLVMRSLASTEM